MKTSSGKSLFTRAALACALSTAALMSAQAQGVPKELAAAIVPNYPPLDYKDPATDELTGFDVDLGKALAAKAGTQLRWEETSFDQMMSAVATGRVNIILSGMTDLASRHDAVHFVDYLKTGPQFYVMKANQAQYPDMQAMCGKKVGSSRRTSFPKEIAQWSDDNCVKAGKPAIVVVGTDGSADAQTQLRQGRLDAAVQGGETLPYLQQQAPGTYTVVGKPIAFQYVGLAVGLKDEALFKALSDAMAAIIADGTYAKITAKWHLEDFAVSKLITDSAE
ncbi:MAG TPA: ABC transporter substrate-binding protein [Bordetella sp.]